MQLHVVHMRELFQCETAQCFNLQQNVGTETAIASAMQCDLKRSLDVGATSSSIHMRTLARGKLSVRCASIDGRVALTFMPTPEKLVSECGGCFSCSESQTGGNWCN
jgi:hypothetical protein